MVKSLFKSLLKRYAIDEIVAFKMKITWADKYFKYLLQASWIIIININYGRKRSRGKTDAKIEAEIELSTVLSCSKMEYQTVRLCMHT